MLANVPKNCFPGITKSPNPARQTRDRRGIGAFFNRYDLRNPPPIAIKSARMDNKTALFLALCIIGVFAADQLYFGWDLHMFIAEKLMHLIDWIAFWR